MEGVVVGGTIRPAGLTYGSSKKGGLDAKGTVGLMEVDSCNLWGLDTSSKLGSGLCLSVSPLTEAKSCLNARAETISIAIVDASSNKGANAILAVLVKLEATSESCSNTICARSNLSSEA